MAHHGVEGGVKAMLRLEGLGLLTAAALGYQTLGGDWKWFAILFLVPDISFAAYLFGPRAGAFGYNAAHSTLGPIISALIAAGAGLPLTLPLIWAAHAGFDRMMGYGLKYSSSFTDTHLGTIGFVRARS